MCGSIAFHTSGLTSVFRSRTMFHIPVSVLVCRFIAFPDSSLRVVTPTIDMNKRQKSGKWVNRVNLRSNVVRAALALATITTTANAQSLKYPQTQKGDVVDNYHGTTVADPYRWLEDQNGQETAAWVKAEND